MAEINEQQAEILVAATSAQIQGFGMITKGRTTVRRGHKILKGREHLFKPLVIDFDVPVLAKRARS